jgi:hypothetical protein
VQPMLTLHKAGQIQGNQDDNGSLSYTVSQQRRTEKAPTGASVGTSNLSQPKLATSSSKQDELSFFSSPTPKERFQL